MVIPLHYIARNVWARRLTTALTAGGLALVVFVFAAMLMLDAGLKQTLVTTGEADNVVLIRKGAETEIQSAITRDQAAAMEMHPAVAMNKEGRPMASREAVVLISLTKSGAASPANVVIRGISPQGVTLRPQVRITAGRVFRPGSSEIIVGSSIAKGFGNVRIGDHLRFAQRDWTVVGHFDAGGSGFDSEIWGDVDQLMQSFRRTSYSSMVVRLGQADGFDKFRADIDVDPRLANEAKREQQFYSDQSRALSTFINILGLTLTTIFSVAAMIGAMITMYASVANRVGEIGTLRALGFQRTNVLAAFLIEAVLLGFVGGVAGLACAALMQFASFSTTNFQTFADLSFRFLLTPGIVVKTLLFSMAMGFIGGFLPALRASRLNIVDALRAR
ncbi:ABC-type transport system, involved in lipoprotein release, permease component [Cupriavidus sp. OV038]|jgi:putative ABC transport system permease protein|uniref:ABC transporter permease n=1 Tax=unclassified Cupriavidus TaxID=2640874 RepID=UPI0008E067C9|nr:MULTISPECIES: ABC transporter permease [unclassified Cupriavidus]SFD37622.1 ABC-type transport system, involved in lipoprotein release, permease component [Cupriavidus sp. OV038]SFQ07864.1 ABC-type transport system, involved in lipoprotein release, permease component [Cupriavidus sp. OV096]